MFKFSVLMSLYDKEIPKYLDESLRSIFSQEYKAHEIVLVFDGPIREELRLVVDKWKDDINIQVVELPVNKGLANALNIGLKHCSFDYVARMDTDDICATDRFYKQVKYMESNPDVDICGSWAIDIDELGCEIQVRKVPTDYFNIKKYIWTCPFIHPSVMFKKSKILECGSYRTDAPPRQDDYDLWIRCIDFGLVTTNIPEPLLFYRYPEGSERKNDFGVGWNRFKLGVLPLFKYNPSLLSLLGLFYPMIRAILPASINKRVFKCIKAFDPRSR